MMRKERSPLTLSWVEKEAKKRKRRISLTTTSPSSTLMTVVVRMPPPHLPGVHRRQDVLLSEKKRTT